jgi:hypothetical protein
MPTEEEHDMSTNQWTRAWRDAGRRAARKAEIRAGRRRTGPGRSLAIGALGAAIGVAIAFLFDPQRGRARRAQLVDRAAALLRDAGGEMERRARHVSATVEGKVAAARVRGGTEPLLNDSALAMKVESELFRDLDVPKGSMNVNVEQGVVVLRGEVGDATTREQLERAAREIAGVWAVDNLLHLPGEPAPTHREAVR